MHPHTCMNVCTKPHACSSAHMCKHTFITPSRERTQYSPSPVILGGILLIQVSREKKISFLFSPLQTKMLGFFHWTKSAMVCTYVSVVGLVCPAFTSPLSVWPGFPCRQREREGTPDSSSPESTPDPGVHGGGPAASPQRRRLFPRSNRIPTLVILSGVFTPILPKPIEERANSAATDLK